MKTINVTPHTFELNTSGVSSEFTMVFEGVTPGGKLQRVRLKLDGPVWVEDFARRLHAYLEHEQKKINTAIEAMQGNT